MSKKILSLWVPLFVAILHLAPIQGEIIETNEIALIENLTDPNTLVLFNVGSTLYEPGLTLSSNQWRLYFADRVQKLVPDPVAAQKLIDHVKNRIVEKLPKKSVEEITPQLIAQLQERHIPVLGITQKEMSTSYSENFGEITSKHLLSLGIDLEKTTSYLAVSKPSEGDHYTFAYGMIFTYKKPEGPAVLSFLKRIKKPSKIVMIDNSYDSLKSVETALASTGIAFEGVKYTRGDIFKENFDPTLGTIEFFPFINEGKILTDEEAKAIKTAHPDKDYQAELDAYILKTQKK